MSRRMLDALGRPSVRGLAVVVLAALLGALGLWLEDGSGEAPPAAAPSVEASATPTAAGTPGGGDLPGLILSPGCYLLDHFTFGSDIRAGEPTTVEFVSSACAARALAARDPSGLGLSIEFVLPPVMLNGPRVEVTLAPAVTAEAITWTGDVTFPRFGAWSATLRVAGLEERTGLLAVDPAELDLAVRAGFPVPPLLTHYVVLDETNREVARWRASEASGTGWLGGRAVFVAPVAGVDWVVAGDPATGEVEPLLEAGVAPDLVVSPAGDAVAVRNATRPYEVRVWSQGTVRAVAVDSSRYPQVSWAPDGRVLLVIDTALRVLRPDGSERSRRELPAGRGGRILDWAPDGAFALVESDDTILRVDGVSGLIAEVFDGQGALRVDDAAISPDASLIALLYFSESERIYRLAVLPVSGRLDAHLASHVIAAYASSQERDYWWVGPLTWSGDGASLLFTQGVATGGQALSALTSSIRRVDAVTGVDRELVAAEQGYYLGTITRSTDGSTYFAWRSICYGCDGGPLAFDVIDARSGAVRSSVPYGLARGARGPDLIVAAPDGTFDVAPSGGITPLGVSPGVRSVSEGPGGMLGIGLDLGRSAVLTVNAETGAQAFAGSSDLFDVPDGVDAKGRVITSGNTLLALDPAAGHTTDLGPVSFDSPVSISPGRTRAILWPDEAADAPPDLVDLLSGERTALPGPADGRRLRFAWSEDGERVAYVEESRVVVTDLAGGAVSTFDLVDGGLTLPLGATASLLSLAWSGSDAIDVLDSQALWRLDLASGRVVRVAELPAAGLFGESVLSRSPDGRTLVLGTALGVYAFDARAGEWRTISSAGLATNPAYRGVPLAWAPDSSAVAYAAEAASSRAPLGTVVAPVDGSGAWLLLGPTPGRLVAPVAWLEGGRIVYAAVAQGI